MWYAWAGIAIIYVVAALAAFVVLRRHSAAVWPGFVPGLNLLVLAEWLSGHGSRFERKPLSPELELDREYAKGLPYLPS